MLARETKKQTENFSLKTKGLTPDALMRAAPRTTESDVNEP